MTTFDGTRYNYQGLCWHTLFKDCQPTPSFEVTVELEPRDSDMVLLKTRVVSFNITVGSEYAIINGLDVVTVSNFLKQI